MSTPGACRESQGVAVAKSSDNQTADFERLLSEGILLSGAGNHESALIRLQSALDLVPESGLAHGAAGFAAMALGDLDTAADHYALARHFLPDDENVVLGYASVLERQGKAALAESVLGDLISRNPAHPGAGFQLARLCYEAGKHDVAVLHLRRNLDLRPEHASSLNLLGLILAREYGDLGAGEKLIRRALELVPDFQAARSNLGWVLAENGRLDEAMDCFEVVLKANPQDAETRLMRAHAYLKSGNFTDGWRDFESRHASPLARPRSGWRDGKEIPPLDGKRVLICAEPLSATSGSWCCFSARFRIWMCFPSHSSKSTPHGKDMDPVLQPRSPLAVCQVSFAVGWRTFRNKKPICVQIRQGLQDGARNMRP